MPQPILRSSRLLLIPLADRHLELEVELDSDPEVMRHLSGRGRSRDEVISSHERRMALATKVDGLGLWMAFSSETGAPSWVATASMPRRTWLGSRCRVGLVIIPT